MSVPAQASRTRTACSCGKASWPTRRAADRGIQCKHRLNRRRLAIDIYSHALPASESRAMARFDVRLGKARRLKRLPKQSDFARDGNRMANADALRRAKNAHAIRPLMERAAGIEPATLAWKARALPLCNARTLWFLTRSGKQRPMLPIRKSANRRWENRDPKLPEEIAARWLHDKRYAVPIGIV